MKIGILGGTFNPIHYGHTFIANYVMDFMGLDKVLFIPSGHPPHKKDVLDKTHREKMVRLAISNNKKFELNTYELQKDDYSYTYNTLFELLNCKENKNNKYYYILGKDAFMELDKWYRFNDLIKIANFIVVSRGEFSNDELLKKYNGVNFDFIDSPQIEISSTQIRNRVFNNKSIKYFVDERVEEYIILNNIYKENFDRFIGV